MSSSSSVPNIFIEAPVIIFFTFVSVRSLENNNVRFSLALSHKRRKLLLHMRPVLGTSSVPTTPTAMRHRQSRRQL